MNTFLKLEQLISKRSDWSALFDRYYGNGRASHFLFDITNLAQNWIRLERQQNVDERHLLRFGAEPEGLFHSSQLAMLANAFLDSGRQVRIVDPRLREPDLEVNGSKCVELKTVSSLARLDVTERPLGLKDEDIMTLVSALRDKTFEGFDRAIDGTVYIVFWCLYTNKILLYYMEDFFKSYSRYEFPGNPRKSLILITGGKSIDLPEQYTLIGKEEVTMFLDNLQERLIGSRLGEISLSIHPEGFGVETNCTEYLGLLGARFRT